jgi:hypothetical protein
MFVCCECCVLPGRGLCDELITRLEKSYRMCYVVVCDLETSRMRRSWPALGRSAKEKKYLFNTATSNNYKRSSRIPIRKNDCIMLTNTAVCVQGKNSWRWPLWLKHVKVLIIIIFVLIVLFGFGCLANWFVMFIVLTIKSELLINQGSTPRLTCTMSRLRARQTRNSVSIPTGIR